MNDIRNADRKIAYFSMEIGFDSNIPTYSGGLGVLAGDTLKSCADLHVPTVAVTLLSEKGYFHQEIDEHGNQHEVPEQWKKEEVLSKLNEKVVISISGRDVVVQGWMYTLKGITGFEVPIIFLDTNLPENSDYDRTITQHLYQGDHAYRIAQELVLGIAGNKFLGDLGFSGLEKYHLNEGHGSFLILELLSDTKIHHGQDDITKRYDFDKIKGMCVFTTHTPVEAGHDKFDPMLVKEIAGNNVEHELIDYFIKDGNVNMTHIALMNTHYVNGVGKKHAEVSRRMFPNHNIGSITNGVYSQGWVSEKHAGLYDKYIPDWRLDPASLRFALLIDSKELWDTHQACKEELINEVNTIAGTHLDPNVLTIGFARRATPYKRMDLIFSNLDWLRWISNDVGKIQLIFAGKAHPADEAGKELLRKLYRMKQELAGSVEIAFVPNYNIDLCKKLVAGVDVWLNTPLKPNEASGTSGMKAAHNGVPQFSVLDGWWIEGCLENVTGWAIGSKQEQSSNEEDSKDLFMKLEKFIVPMFYTHRDLWITVMKQAIALNASYFNTHRMVKDYVLYAYFDGRDYE